MTLEAAEGLSTSSHDLLSKCFDMSDSRLVVLKRDPYKDSHELDQMCEFHPKISNRTKELYWDC